MLTHQSHPEGSPEQRAVKLAVVISALSLVIGASATLTFSAQQGFSDGDMAAVRTKAYSQHKPLGSAFEQRRAETQTAQNPAKSQLQ